MQSSAEKPELNLKSYYSGSQQSPAHNPSINSTSGLPLSWPPHHVNHWVGWTPHLLILGVLYFTVFYKFPGFIANYNTSYLPRSHSLTPSLLTASWFCSECVWLEEFRKSGPAPQSEPCNWSNPSPLASYPFRSDHVTQYWSWRSKEGFRERLSCLIF